MDLSDRVSTIKPSATVAVTEKAAALRARGIEVIDLGAGEPDFETPPHVKEAASRAMREGKTRYTPVGGTLELRQAVVEKLSRDNGFTYDTSEVIVSCGGKHSLYLGFHALFGNGEEVIVPAPCWVSHPAMLTLAGARPRLVRSKVEAGFKLTPAELEAAMTPQTRAFVLNSPSNPAGVAYDSTELRELADILARREVFIVCDDVYEMMVYGDFDRSHILSVRPDLREKALLVNSVSKTYAMTGWRIGYAAGPRKIIAGMSTLQGQMTSNACSVAQAAAVAALRGPQDHVQLMVKEFERRRDFVVARLNAIPGVICPRPQGAFYVFPRIEACLRPDKGICDGDELAAYLIEDVGVALVGGNDFGYPQHVRISYANSMENLEKGLDRVEDALRKLASN
jgi:aspartate aminotransferase